MTAESTLAIFVMLGISSLAVFWARRVRLPHTVFLVVLGLVLGFLVEAVPFFHFFGEFKFTPELLFYFLLPTLIFESAYNINVRRVVEDTPIILILSIIGLLVSTVAIGGALYFLLGFLGFTVPFIVPLLFGALISATDPVAVLALFKEFGAPRRLSLVFEGESLFNDATSVALFVILLDIALNGYMGFTSIGEGVLTFLVMMIGGTIFGVLIGSIFAKIIGFTRENEIASITLTIVLAHVTFILAELMHHVSIGGFSLTLSPIIATTIAALFMGNFGRSKIHPGAEEFVEKLWGQLAFMANSLIFILIGFFFISIVDLSALMLGVIGATILIVAAARALSIYPVVEAFNLFTTKERQIPRSWQHLLSWGSLRGALAITMVLLVPEDITFASWNLPLSPRDFLLSLTVGCIFATLFIKAPTVQPIMRRLKLDALTEIETVEGHEARALIHHEVVKKLQSYQERGIIKPSIAQSLLVRHNNHFNEAVASLKHTGNDNLALRVLRMYAIGIERKYLKELYSHDEIDEAVYRHVAGKLQLQLEAIEAGNIAPNMSIATDGRDVFDRLDNWIRSFVNPETDRDRVEHRYMYYRAQAILSRKVLNALQAIDHTNAEYIFTPEALTHVIELYTTFTIRTQEKMKELEVAHPTNIEPLSAKLAACSVHKVEETLLHELFENQLITPKLYITLKEELQNQA